MAAIDFGQTLVATGDLSVAIPHGPAQIRREHWFLKLKRQRNVAELHCSVSGVVDFFDESGNGCQMLEENFIHILCLAQINQCGCDTLLN